MTMTTTRREERDVFPPRPSAEPLDSDEPRPLHTRSLDDTLSLAASALGSLALVWVAYEEGPERWGQDYGALDESGGNPLYNERSVRVVCLVGNKLFRPAADLPTSKNPPPRLPFGVPAAQRFERGPRYNNPRLGLDGKGRLWLTYRQKFGTRYTTHPGSYWLTFARRLDGDH